MRAMGAGVPVKEKKGRGDSMNSDYLATINRFSDLKVLVIGDAMLDVYLDGSANRICREAPVPIVDIRDVKTSAWGRRQYSRQPGAIGCES